MFAWLDSMPWDRAATNIWKWLHGIRSVGNGGGRLPPRHCTPGLGPAWQAPTTCAPGRTAACERGSQGGRQPGGAIMQAAQAPANGERFQAGSSIVWLPAAGAERAAAAPTCTPSLLGSRCTAGAQLVGSSEGMQMEDGLLPIHHCSSSWRSVATAVRRGGTHQLFCPAPRLPQVSDHQLQQ